MINALNKSVDDKLAYRGVLAGAYGAMFVPLLFFVPLPTKEVALVLMVSMAVHLFYQMVMVRSYTLGDFSRVYPLARGMAPLLTGLGAILFLGESLTAIEALGLGFVAVGLVAFATEDGFKGVAALAMLFAALTGLAVTAYNLVDATGVRLAEVAFTYIAWLFVLDGLQMSIATLVMRRSQFPNAVRSVWKPALWGGLMTVFSYSMYLYALRIGQTAEIAALRETSVIFAALIGAFWLKESFGPRRIAAALVVVTGIVMMQIS